MDSKDQQPVPRVAALGLVFLEILKIVLIAALTIMLVRYLLFKPFYVEGASMVPSFNEHEYLIIDELSYRLRAPERGESVVFRYPYNPQVFYLKRIICLPLERCKIEKGTVIVFNEENPKGLVLEETYIKEKIDPDFDADVTLGEDEYYVMGANRGNSYDSRKFGPVRKGHIIGRVWIRGWPLSKAGIVKSGDYGLQE